MTITAVESAFPSSGPGLARLVAQRGFFTGPTDRVCAELYCLVEAGHAGLERSRAVLAAHSRVSHNTYFGRFPASYWQRWSTVTEVILHAVTTGVGRLRVCASDRDGIRRTLTTRRVVDTATEPVDIAVAVDRFVDGGAIWAEFDTDTAELTVEDVSWTVAAPSALRPTALVMCTFNRADDCVATLAALTDDTAALLMVDAVYVIDQGDDLVTSRAGFAAVAERLGAALHYRRQPNLGGAGGFTRGLYEVADVQGADHANVLFMDDDILLEPDVVVRLTAFANRSVEPVIVGAQMLHLLHPNKLHVGAETARFAPIAPGEAVPGALDKVDLREHSQDQRVEADYNAWWCCLIPSEVVADLGYPMPLFFQWDDVEYGYRALARGHATVTLPGAGIWHHDFDWKDEDDPTRYFTLRNALIIDALHGDFQPRISARHARRWILQCLVSMRYAQAATLIKAIQDFLRGPDTLRDGGAEALREVRQLRARYPETARYPANAVPGIPATARRIDVAGPAPSRETAVLLKRLIWQLRGKTTGSVAVSARDAHWWHVSRFETVVVTDASQQAVRLRCFDRAALLRLSRDTVRVLRQLRRDGRTAQQRLQATAPELASRESWQRLFTP